MKRHIELIHPVQFTGQQSIGAGDAQAGPTRLGEPAKGDVGFLSNNKPNTELFLTEIRRLVQQETGWRRALSTMKPSASVAAGEAVLEQLKGYRIVVNAIGD